MAGALAAGLFTNLPHLMAQTQASPPTPDADRVPLIEGYTSSWVGNTGPGRGRRDSADPIDQWTQHWAYGMAVSSDGRVYLTAHWEESGRRGGIYKDGRGIGHAFYRDGIEPDGEEVAVNDTHAFYSASRSQIVRYTLDGTEPTRLFDTGAEIMGLAATADRIAVTHHGAGVTIYDMSGKVLSRFDAPNPGAVAFTPTGDLLVVTHVSRTGERDDVHDKNWIAAGGTPTIVRFSPDGRRLAESKAPDPGWIPSSIAVDRADPSQLYVGDASRQQLIYRLATGDLTVKGSFGIPGGYLAGPVPGVTGPLRFMRPWGVGTDREGHVFVMHAKPHTWTARLVVEKYTPQGQLVWNTHGLAWVDTLQPVASTDGVVMYSGSDRFAFDYQADDTNQGTHWSHQGVTYDPWTYPHDPREHSPFIVEIDGRRLMYTIGQFSTPIAFHRFEEGSEIAIPAGAIFKHAMEARHWAPGHPTDGKFIWTDRDGDGQPEAGEYEEKEGGDGESFCTWVDSRGNIWDAFYDSSMGDQHKWNIRRFNLGGFTEGGAPVYSYDNTTTFGNPAEMSEIGRLEYHPESDTMYLMGFTDEHPRRNDIGEADPTAWGTAGRAIFRFDDWTKPTRKLREGYPITLPYYGRTALGAGSGMAGPVAADQRTVDFENSLLLADFTVPADAGATEPGKAFLFVIYGVNGPATLGKDSRNEIRVFDVADGKLVGRMIGKDPINPAQLGWLDTRRALKGIRRANGEYVLVTEEDHRGKFVVYRWNPSAPNRSDTRE